MIQFTMIARHSYIPLHRERFANWRRQISPRGRAVARASHRAVAARARRPISASHFHRRRRGRRRLSPPAAVSRRDVRDGG